MRVLLVTIDHMAHLNIFPMGVAYIAAVAQEDGHEVEIYNQELWHYPDSHIQQYLDENEPYDVIGVGIYGYQMFKKSIEVCKYINRAKNRPIVVLGSNGPSACPEYFLEKTQADYIIKGEGETSWRNLLKTLEEKGKVEDCLGVAWMENGQLKQTPTSPLIKPVDSVPFPAWDLFPMDAYFLHKHVSARHTDRCMTVLYSRGCPQNCNFCFRLYDSYRLRSFDNLFEEIKILKRRWNVTHIDFVDENIMVSPKAAYRFGEAMLKADLGVTWNCHGNTPAAVPEALEIMKAAGLTHINFGIESLDPIVIKNMGKRQTVEDAYMAVDNCNKLGIEQGLNIIWGNIGDTEESLRLGADFLIKYNNTHNVRTVKPVTPYPGTPLYHYALEKKLLKGPADFYEKYQNSDRLTCNFTDIEDGKFYELLYKANSKIMKAYHKKAGEEADAAFQEVYFNYDPVKGFRGPRHR